MYYNNVMYVLYFQDDLPALEVEETLELSKDTGCVLCEYRINYSYYLLSIRQNIWLIPGEYVVTTLDGLLDDKPTEQEIESALESICSILPSTVEIFCKY